MSTPALRSRHVAASIGEKEGAFWHLVRERHERDVDALDAVF